MSWGWRLSSALVALTLLVARPVGAEPSFKDEDDALLPLKQPPPQPPPRLEFSERPVHLMGVIGLGSLVGFAGVCGGYSLHDRFEFGAGVGVNTAGLIGGPYVRVRPKIEANAISGTLHAIAVDVGLSMGGLNYTGGLIKRALAAPAEEQARYRSDFVAWAQLEFGWEMLRRDGLSLRAGYSGSFLLNPDSVTCTPPNPGDTFLCEDPMARFLLGGFFSIGSAF